MTSRHQTVFNGESCALALSSTAPAAESYWDGSDSEQGRLDYNDTTPRLNGGGDLQAPGAGYDPIALTAVPAPSVAARPGGIGLLALVRRRRG